MNFKFKPFNELTPQVLYQILKLRQDVFMLEQNVLYSDIDGVDQQSLHFWIEEEGSLKMLSYLRLVLDKSVSKASIGRIITDPEARGRGLAKSLIKKAIHYAESHHPSWRLTMCAQEHLTDFYETFGFIVTGEPFFHLDNDPIPHVPMEYRRD